MELRKLIKMKENCTDPDTMTYIFNGDSPKIDHFFLEYTSAEPDKLSLIDSNCWIIESE